VIIDGNIISKLGFGDIYCNKCNTGKNFKEEISFKEFLSKITSTIGQTRKSLQKAREQSDQVSQDSGTENFEVLEDTRCLILDNIGQQTTKIMGS
jgi:hypothetical protein